MIPHCSVKSHAFGALSLTIIQGIFDSAALAIAGDCQKATPGPFGSGVVKAELSSSTDTESSRPEFPCPHRSLPLPTHRKGVDMLSATKADIHRQNYAEFGYP